MFQNEYIFHITQIRFELKQTEGHLLFIDKILWLFINLLPQYTDVTHTQARTQ